MTTIQSKPQFSFNEMLRFTRTNFDLEGDISELNSERDQNFLISDAAGERYIIKVSNSQEDFKTLAFQNAALLTIQANDPELPIPSILPNVNGEIVSFITDKTQMRYFVRLMTYLPGISLAEFENRPPQLLYGVGALLGRLDKSLVTFWHPNARRYLPWSILETSEVLKRYQSSILDLEKRSLVDHFLLQFETFVQPELCKLRHGVIHNDGNDHNILVKVLPDTNLAITGLLDFGDMLSAPYANEPAVAAAYQMMAAADPIQAAATLITGYHSEFSLLESEIDLLYYLIAIRVATSVTLTAFQKQQLPENDYLAVHEEQAWNLLQTLIVLEPTTVTEIFAEACDSKMRPTKLSNDEIIRERRIHLGRNLSISYSRPLNIVRGFRQYLYDAEGKAYLDGVNNVAHVGHCHPRVVRAGQRQMAILNTNTRYLNEGLVQYAERLCATLPDPLSVVYFVCTGSEANELALRLAKAHTGNDSFVVIDGAYHGNSGSLIEISPYKFSGPGGQGKPEHVYVLDLPDQYRGTHAGLGSEVGMKYAKQAQQILQAMKSSGHLVAAFIGESLLGCGGQIVLPEGYLKLVYQIIRASGGVCIADEVQVGFGRIGSHFWGFETQHVVPDIVTMGKPIGNGHPLAAVVTTPEIARSFDNGMEYFNTFGGNPVSCAIGMAVLDVIEDENLQAKAKSVGAYLMKGLQELKRRYEIIGDVRGLGLFIGVEFVRNTHKLIPAAEEASMVTNALRDRGILLSTDGPDHNVLKIKPPMVFNQNNADQLVDTLDSVLAKLPAQKS